MYALVTLAGISPNDSQISLLDFLPISSLIVRYVSHMIPISEKKTKLNTCASAMLPELQGVGRGRSDLVWMAQRTRSQTNSWRTTVLSSSPRVSAPDHLFNRRTMYGSR